MEEQTMNPKTKHGIFYFTDNRHYHAKERERWIAEFLSLRIGWLLLTSEDQIAIPEPFLQTLLECEITPIIRMVRGLVINQKPTVGFELLVKTYSDWGVRYIQLFDRPNSSAFWDSKSWARGNLVERFIDLYLPYAEMLLKYNIRPIFPSLEVAKGFWDTAFLRLALESLERRRHQWLIDELVLSAYMHLYDPSRPLTWGAGGPERWPKTKPYQDSAHSQDHRGLYIADWYETLARATVGKSLPIILMDDPFLKPLDLSQEEIHRRTFHVIQRLLDPREDEAIEIDGLRLEPFPREILCLGFYGLPSDEIENEPRAWFLPNGKPEWIVKEIKEVLAQNGKNGKQPRTIPHALLLPQLKAEELHQELERLKPFLIQYQPKIIFSLQEAFQVEHLWLPEGLTQLSELEIAELERHSCILHTLNLAGTRIAS